MIEISVKIPTWQPDLDYLRCAVTSALKQSHGTSSMQIELVDDASPDFDVAAFADRFESDRVSWHRNAQRLGMAQNWNQCIARSKSPWVHILHQDDVVLDGFYAAIAKGLVSDHDVAAAFCASYFLDSSGLAWNPRQVKQKQAGILQDWRQHVFVDLAIQCSAIVVRRDIYQQLGGFDPRLHYTLDWALWKQLVVSHAVWFEPRPLACFRMHRHSETSFQRNSGAHLKEIFQSIDESSGLLPLNESSSISRKARRHYAEFAVEESMKTLASTGNWRQASGLLGIARRETSFIVVLSAVVKVAVRALVRPFMNRREQIALP